MLHDSQAAVNIIKIHPGRSRAHDGGNASKICAYLPKSEMEGRLHLNRGKQN